MAIMAVIAPQERLIVVATRGYHGFTRLEQLRGSPALSEELPDIGTGLFVGGGMFTGRDDLSQQRDERGRPFPVPEPQLLPLVFAARLDSLHPFDQHQGELIAALDAHAVYQAPQPRRALRRRDSFQLRGIERSGFGREMLHLERREVRQEVRDVTE